jgi:anti-sigma factor RsiW
MTEGFMHPECVAVEPLLAAHVDGQANPEDAARLSAHLAKCAACRERVAGEKTVREVLHARRERLTVCASAQLRQRCAACADERPRTAAAPSPRRFAHRAWIPLSFAASVALAIAVVFISGLNRNVEALATGLAVDHVKCFQFAPDHAEIDATLAAATWQRRYGWSLTVPRSEPVEQLELLDVRRCMSIEGASAHILYKWRGSPLSVYVINNAPAPDMRAERLVSSLGQDAVMWSDNGRTYAVIGRGSRNDLEHVAHYLRTVAR